MKLSLSVAALERLLAGDSELEVELRHQVVREFIKKHIEKNLTAVIESEAFNETLKAMRVVLHETIKATVGTVTRADAWKGTTEGHNLSAEIKSIIDGAVRKAVDEAVIKAIDDKVVYYERHWQQYLRNKVEQMLEKNIKERIDAGVQQRLQLAVDAIKTGS